MNCRSGCVEKNHDSYAQCLQSANVTVAATINSPLQSMFEGTKSDLVQYRSARANGIQPGGTTPQKVADAVSATRLLGRPYNGEVDVPANLIVTKKAAAYANKTTNRGAA